MRVVRGLGLLVAIMMIVDTVSSKPPDEEAVKGIRAIVAHGKQLSTPIAIGNIEVATSLYNSIARGMFTGDKYPYPYSKLRPAVHRHSGVHTET